MSSIEEEVKLMQIPLQELSDATNGFSDQNRIGRGGFGKVYKGVFGKDRNMIAVKMLDPQLGQGDHEFKTEIALLSVYKHENIVSLLGFCDEDGKKMLVYKFESKGSLDQHLNDADLTWIQRLQICLDAARGLQYLHDGVEPERRILHRDVKSANILLDENLKAKISDFGLSKMGPANVESTFVISNPCGTFGYIDPEYTTRGYLTQKSDVYSFGVVLFEVLCGRLARIMEYKDERQFLTTLITIHWKRKSLDKINNYDLRRQINTASLNTFSSIAYRCLMSGNERPTMKKVVKQLQKALDNQLMKRDTSIYNMMEAKENLLACAEAMERADLRLAEILVNRAGVLARSQPGTMKKVEGYFARALAQRIYGFNPDTLQKSQAKDNILEMHFYEIAPYLKFAHFTANQAMLEAVGNNKKVHVIDFSIKDGMQWPAFMQALALRPGGPPSFRLSGVGPPSGDNTGYLQEVGLKLARFAETINVEFEYRGFIVESLADIELGMLDLREGEVVTVNSVFELHRLLGRPGAIEKVLFAVKEMKPKIVTVVEQEANHNGLGFLERFTESLDYYSTMFGSLETSGGGVGAKGHKDKIMSEMYLGKQICNVVACEGSDRVERHETLTQWKARLYSCGFESVHLGSNAYKQASNILPLFTGGNGYQVEENNGCLMLGWGTRSLIATSAWKVR